MRTSIINADKAKKYRIFYKIVAAAVWIMVWQLTSMWLKQEILLASPVSVIKRLTELIVMGDFWKSVVFSFVRIILGFSLALILGTVLAALSSAFFAVEVLMEPLIMVIKSYASCFFYHSVPDLDPIQKLIRFYFVSHGFSSGIYKYSGRNQADGQTASGDGRFLWSGSGKKNYNLSIFPRLCHMQLLPVNWDLVSVGKRELRLK